MTTLLPSVASRDDYLAVTTDPEQRRAVADAVSARHDLPRGELDVFPGGSLLVLSISPALVLKLYSPLEPQDCEREVAALRAVEGRLPLETPRVVATGELDGWPYLVMSRLPGQPANSRWLQRRPEDEPWKRVPRDQQLGIVEEVGAAVAALHRVPVAGLPAAMRPDWETFLGGQRESCVARLRSRGLSEAWLEQVPGFLESVELDSPAKGVLLHTEIMRDHVLLQEHGGGWRLSGLLDFEPAMVGDPEYELASVAVFLTSGDLGLFRAFLRGYGIPAHGRSPELARRVLAYLLLHRYGDLHWALKLLPEHPAATTLDDLAAAWWPLGDG